MTGLKEPKFSPRLTFGRFNWIGLGEPSGREDYFAHGLDLDVHAPWFYLG